MRYVVTGERNLFEDSDKYTFISIEEALSLLEPMRVVSLDTETEGFDVYTKRLLSVQLGNFDTQILIDCRSIDIRVLKDFLESDRLFILVNAKFDLKFFLHKRIVIRNVYDLFLAEKILYLGFLPGQPALGLKDMAIRYLGIELDKSIRGKIHYRGLSEEVIVYACDDVKYLEPIKALQEEKLREKQLLTAVDIENHFVPVLAYIEYCGVKLDIPRWQNKMKNDTLRYEEAKKELDDWIINYADSHPELPISTVRIVQLTLWDSENGNSLDLGYQRYQIRKNKDARRIPAKDIVTDTVKTEAWAIPNKNPWVLRQVQADLFSETPPAKCLIKWTSNAQVIPVLEALGFDLWVKDKETGEMKKSIEATVIEPQKDKSPFASLYLEFKAAQKIVSTYGQNFLDQINPVSHRIHTQFNQLMDTGRLSCGGTNKQTKEKYLNLQNLPNDKETRACFIASPGNTWISVDYSGQESVIIAEVSQDPKMIHEFLHGSGDMHSLVAKAAYPEILKDVATKDVKRLFHELRNDVKSQVEFPINYAGDWNTIHQHSGKPIEECKRIYDNYMRDFVGVKKYQDFCRKDVMEKGYILLNPLTGHRANIYDFPILTGIRARLNQDYWPVYNNYKGSEHKLVPTSVLRQLYERFAQGEDLDSLAGDYEYTVKTATSTITKSYRLSMADVFVHPVKYYFRRKSSSEKQSVNYRIQGTGALCFKIASIKFYNYLLEKDLLFRVLYTVPVHDEINIEAPDDIAKETEDALMKCMVDAGKIFCKTVPLKAEAAVGKHWIH